MSGDALLRPQTRALPHAEPGGVSAPYWQSAERGELIYQVCAFCESVNVPPTEICADCQVGGLRWETSAGLGRLYSWTIVHRPVTPAFDVPYAPAIVELDEGFRLVTNIIDIAPDDIVADMRVRVVFHEDEGGLVLPYFRPA